MKNPRFNSLYHQFSTPLFRFIAKRLRKDQAAVEEVFEETIVAGWKGYKTFKHKSSYFTWLCRIALNKIADYYHDQVHANSRIIVPLIDSLNGIDTNTLSPEESLALNELRTSVNDCLNLLPYEKRRLLWFRYWKDYSYEQIGKILGISERAVEGKIYRAKHEFARVWSSTANLVPKNS
jgi:RNA polymerase sigma-70 factor (ECF subfamily)